MTDEWRTMPREVKNKIRAAQMGNRNAWKEWLDAKYAEVKHLVEKGVAVTCACEAVGITRDQYYRRKRIETTGRDRKDV
jgi:hypothetical protein